jgi:predicted small lipoprotein YifL
MKVIALLIAAIITLAGCGIEPPGEHFRAAVAACDQGDASVAFQLGDDCIEARETYYSKYAPGPGYVPSTGIH